MQRGRQIDAGVEQILLRIENVKRGSLAKAVFLAHSSPGVACRGDLRLR